MLKTLSVVLVGLLVASHPVGAQNSKTSIIELRIARVTAAPGYAARRLADSTFYVSDTVLISDVDIVRADTSWEQGHLIIPLRLTPQSSARLAAETGRHVGDRLAVFFDGQFSAASIIVSAISGPRLTLEAVGPPVADRLAKEVLARWPKPN